MFNKYLLYVRPLDGSLDGSDDIILEFNDLDECYDAYSDYCVEEFDCSIYRRMAHSYKSL